MDWKIVEAEERTPQLLERLLAVWRASVRETHLFLSESEIERLQPFALQALQEVSRLAVLEDGRGVPAAFLGAEGRRLEMLFVAPGERGKGLGKRLLRYGVERYAVNELTVNEQNPLAVGFYERMGFRTVKRTGRDEQGNPYPLLYMELRQDG